MALSEDAMYSNSFKLSFRASRRQVEKSVLNRFLRFVPTSRDFGRNDTTVYEGEKLCIESKIYSLAS
jgi:hypothetical protein